MSRIVRANLHCMHVNYLLQKWKERKLQVGVAMDNKLISQDESSRFLQKLDKLNKANAAT